MRILQALMIALSMYSKIPVPGVEWSKENMRYAMCFFPVVGMVTGGVLLLAGEGLRLLGAGPFFRGAVMTLLPLLVSGGIHMDGFMDTMDALSSYGDREKKLAILKDPHAGAFAILGAGGYLLWSAAVWSELPTELLGNACLIYTVSRSLSGFSVVAFPAARNSGLLKTFQDGAQKRAVGCTMWVYLAVCLLAAVRLNPAAAVWTAAAAAGSFLYYYWTCKSKFGGVTGDLAGYFLEVSELAMLTGLLICGYLM